MDTFIVKRIGQAALIVWGVMTLLFLLIHTLPGDPSSIYLSPEIPPATMEILREKMGLNQAIHTRYFHWLLALCSGEFGISFSHHRPVLELLYEAIPNTLAITASVVFIELLAGSAIGVWLALSRRRTLNSALNSLLMAGYSTPSFWVALMALYLFALKLGWFPAGQVFSSGPDGAGPISLWTQIRHLVLPVLVMAIPFVAQAARFVQISLREVLNTEYIRTAYSFGIPRHKVILKYALRNASLPFIAFIGMQVPFLLGGSVIIEQIFSWPGMGRLTLQAFHSYDFPMVLGSGLVAALSVVVGNLCADLLSLWADPRLRDSLGVSA